MGRTNGDQLMPLPAIPAIAAILSAAAPWISRFFLAKGALLFAGFLGRIGIVIATNEVIMEPLLGHIMGAWASLPGDFTCWMGMLGVTKVASIVVSALTLLSIKQVFLAKA